MMLDLAVKPRVDPAATSIVETDFEAAPTLHLMSSLVTSVTGPFDWYPVH